MGVRICVYRALLTTAVVAISACASNNGSNGAPNNPTNNDTADAGPDTIVIQDFVYLPANLVAAPGTTLKVLNRDLEAHSVTSESKLGNFVLGAVGSIEFDTGVIAPGGSGTFSVPSNASVGTVIPYFCTVHKSSMVEGRVTIR